MRASCWCRCLANLTSRPTSLKLMDHRRGNQVSHLCHAGQLELMNEFLLFAIGMSDPLVLAQMLNQESGLNVSRKRPSCDRSSKTSHSKLRPAAARFPVFQAPPERDRDRLDIPRSPTLALDRHRRHRKGQASASAWIDGVRSRAAPVWSFQRHSRGTAIIAPRPARI